VPVFEIRPAHADDVPAVTAVIAARSSWMEERALPSWRSVAEDLAGQAAAPETQMWVLTERSRVVGFTTLAREKPLWGWSEDEAGEPAYYLYTTCTDPAYQAAKPGSLVAWWAVDKAAADGRAWVRRGTIEPGLVDYYRRQGFTLAHEVQRKHSLVYLMARRAQHLPEVKALVAEGSTVPVC
jgi:hypothetical protein